MAEQTRMGSPSISTPIPSTASFTPLGDDAKRLPELKSQIKGILDMEAAVDSPEAAQLKKKMASLPQDKVKPFMEDLELFGNYIHGTHVAGIASKGNPFARLLIARITFDYHIIPEKPTVAQAHKDALADQMTVEYFKQHGVRVVNMSWGGSLKDVEDALEENGVGDATERKKEAREIFEIGRDGLYNALKSAPDILFVTAAGNSDNDVNFDEVIPSSFDPAQPDHGRRGRPGRRGNLVHELRQERHCLRRRLRGRQPHPGREPSQALRHVDGLARGGESRGEAFCT